MAKYRVWFNDNGSMDWFDCTADDAESAGDIVIDNTGNPEGILLIEEWHSSMPNHSDSELDGML